MNVDFAAFWKLVEEGLRSLDQGVFRIAWNIAIADRPGEGAERLFVAGVPA